MVLWERSPNQGSHNTNLFGVFVESINLDRLKSSSVSDIVFLGDMEVRGKKNWLNYR